MGGPQKPNLAAKTAVKLNLLVLGQETATIVKLANLAQKDTAVVKALRVDLATAPSPIAVAESSL